MRESRKNRNICGRLENIIVFCYFKFCRLSIFVVLYYIGGGLIYLFLGCILCDFLKNMGVLKNIVLFNYIIFLKFGVELKFGVKRFDGEFCIVVRILIFDNLFWLRVLDRGVFYYSGLGRVRFYE